MAAKKVQANKIDPNSPGGDIVAQLNKISSPSSSYKRFLSWAESMGGYLRFNLDSKLTSFHDLYRVCSPTSYERLPEGVNFPVWFSHLSPAGMAFLEELQDKVLDPATYSNEFLGSDALTKDDQEFGLPLLIYRAGRASDITDHVLGLETLKAKSHRKTGGGRYHLGIAHSPNKLQPIIKTACREVFAYVPEIDWFKPELRDLKFSDIIKIFPPYEEKMFKLIVGRACVGRSGAVHPGTHDVITHGFRKAGIVVGEPKVGKSKTLDGIKEALMFLGYDVVAMGDFGTRFNQGGIIASHMAYNDDLTIDSLEKMLTAHSFKSVVTGGTERVENKGVDAVEVVSNTVILANCNELKPEITYSLDSGAINRLGLISTYRIFEMEELSEIEGHDIHPCSHMKYLMKKYDTDMLSLYLRAVRDCTDFFLDKISNGRDVDSYSESLLPYLIIQNHKNALENFIKFSFVCYAIRDMKGQGNYLPEITIGSLGKVMESTRFIMIDMRANNLRKNMKADWESHKRDLGHPYWAQRKLLISSVDKAYEAYNSSVAEKDLGVTLENMFQVLRLRDGFTMAKRQSHITRVWETTRSEKNRIYATAQRLMSTMTPEEIAIITDPKSRASTEWIYGPDYDPQKM